MANKKVAKVSVSYMTINEVIEFVDKHGVYKQPEYQRETNCKKASEFFADLFWKVKTFSVPPMLNSIHVRINSKGELEIIDGQHRVVMFKNIKNGLVRLPNKHQMSNRCQLSAVVDYAGDNFRILNDEDQEAIMNMIVPVFSYDCTDIQARAIFHSLNAGKPLNTNDKVRNNYCDNNLYRVVTEQSKKEKVAKIVPLKTEGAIGNFIYRCIHASEAKNICFSHPSEMNPLLLDKHKGMSKDGARKLVDKTMKKVYMAIECLEKDMTATQHGIMGMYIYLASLSDSAANAVVKKIMKKKDVFNETLNHKMVLTGVNFVDTPHETSRSLLAKKLVEDTVREVIS